MNQIWRSNATPYPAEFFADFEPFFPLFGKELPFQNDEIGKLVYQMPVFPIDAQGSSGGKGSPLFSSSMEMSSGLRINAM